MYHEHHEVPFYCPTTTDSWQIVLEQDTQYDIKVVRTLGRFWDDCQLYVNGAERQCDLKWNPCVPFCSSEGLFDWEENGHTFLLVFRGPLLLQPCGKIYLFINGFEAFTSVEFSTFWRRRGQRIFVLGLLFIIVGSVVAFLMMTISDGYMHFDEILLLHVPLILIGLLYLVAGVCTMIKFRNFSRNVGYNAGWTPKIEFI